MRRIVVAAAEFMELADKHPQGFKGIVKEVRVVAHKLDGRIDFMGNARGEPPDRFQFLGLTKFHLRYVSAGNIPRDRLDSDGLFVAVDQPRIDFERHPPAILRPDFNLEFRRSLSGDELRYHTLHPLPTLGIDAAVPLWPAVHR